MAHKPAFGLLHKTRTSVSLMFEDPTWVFRTPYHYVMGIDFAWNMKCCLVAKNDCIQQGIVHLKAV
jgi:hypothetical protein